MTSDRLDDIPGRAGCTEVWEALSGEQSGDHPEPQCDLSVSFVDFDPSDSPFRAAASDPILREIGNTPLVPHPANEQIVCKMERQNPTLSHKDRLGVGMILGLREMGELDSGQRVVEASSGNTAGAVALATNRLEHPCTIVMRESSSRIKRGFVKALGAEVIKVPGNVSHDSKYYYQNVAETYAEEHDAVYLNQYERNLNRYVHSEWTGAELHKQLADTAVTHIVGAVSTTGIVSGIAEYFEEHMSNVQVIGADGKDSNVWREFRGEESTEYDVDVEGLGQWRTTDVINKSAIDDIIPVADSVAKSRAKHEVDDNGLLIGPSSGAAMEIAQEITQEIPDANVVVIVHDGPEQYFEQVEGW
ncbi:MAG: cysteine synthase family protein [Haloarculaceae archaeon]